uniref:Uncharacterized protein n=1 Tax=Magallana gigas TaxID=29159 RepID=A0A8W8K8Z0_MAGGI
MKVLFCTTILVISISAVYCISPPNGTCAHTAYHYCDWAGWGTWSNCSNQCGSGTQERKRFICCPPEYNASSILQCVQQLCAHSVSDYIKHQSCTASTGCKGTTRSAVKTSIPASTVSSSSVSSSSKGNGASNASQLSRNKLQEEGGTGGVIAGAIIGVLAVAGLSGLLAFFLYRRWKKNKEERKVEPEENGGENPVSQKPPVSTSLN